MKLLLIFYITPLYAATQNENKYIVELLLARPDIDINLNSVLTYLFIAFYILFLVIWFNYLYFYIIKTHKNLISFTIALLYYI